LLKQAIIARLLKQAIIARWLKQAIIASDLSKDFTAHSTRSVSLTAGALIGMSIKEVMDRAG